MELNWTPEVIAAFITAILFALAVIVSYWKLRHYRIISLFFIRLSWFFIALYFLLEALSFLLLNLFLAQVYNTLTFPAVLFLIIGINISKKESIYSLSLIIMCCLGPLFYLFAFLPNSVEIVIEYGFSKIATIGIFDIFSIIFIFLPCLFLIYWAVITWINTPFIIKKEASMLLLGASFIFPLATTIYIFSFWIPLTVMISDIILSIGALTVTYAINREPKLLYILPFAIHRILVKNEEGHPLYDYDWSESDINEMLFSGFINAVQLMSEEVMHIGGLLDINLQKGILILYKAKYITVGLVASKSSKLLRESVRNFSHDFEKQFEYLLKTSCIEMEKYESAYILIDKHFSNFPYRIIKSKHHPLMISEKYNKVPLQLDAKYEQIFDVEEELEGIKAELIRSPVRLEKDFLKTYEELKNEPEQVFQGEEEEKKAS